MLGEEKTKILMYITVCLKSYGFTQYFRLANKDEVTLNMLKLFFVCCSGDEGRGCGRELCAREGGRGGGLCG